MIRELSEIFQEGAQRILIIELSDIFQEGAQRIEIEFPLKFQGWAHRTEADKGEAARPSHPPEISE